MPWTGRSDRPVVVRCQSGHLFTTIWVPLGSFKALRLGRFRFQRCPVGEHWAFVARVPDDELGDVERAQAELFFDGQGP